MEQQIIIEFTHPIGEYAFVLALVLPTLLLGVMLIDSFYGLIKKRDPNEENMW